MLLERSVVVRLLIGPTKSYLAERKNLTFHKINKFEFKFFEIVINEINSYNLAFIYVLFTKWILFSKEIDLILGVDREGLILASVFSKIMKKPFSYISFEIMFRTETSFRFKHIETYASKNVKRWYIQDKLRAQLLSKENGMSLENCFTLPLASRGIGKLPNSRVRDKLNIPADQKVAIMFGGLQKWSMVEEVLSSIQNWPKNWSLILHFRYGNTSTKLNRILNGISSTNKEKIYISDFRFDDIDNLGELLNGIDAGLAFYNPSFLTKFNGNNIKYIGLASGKINTLLRYGIPIITFRNNSIYYDLNNEKEFGCFIKNIDEIPRILVRSNFNSMKKNAIIIFNKYFNFQNIEVNLFKDFISISS